MKDIYIERGYGCYLVCFRRHGEASGVVLESSILAKTRTREVAEKKQAKFRKYLVDGIPLKAEASVYKL